MVEQLRNATLYCSCLDDVYEVIAPILFSYRQAFREKRLRFVTGIMTSDGMENFEKNVTRLKLFTVVLDKSYSFPAFCASNVFDQNLYERLNLIHIPVVDRGKLLQQFWRRVLQTPGLITDVSFTPRYHLSKGAMDELETAKKLGLSIDFPDETLIGKENLQKLKVVQDFRVYEQLGVWDKIPTFAKR